MALRQLPFMTQEMWISGTINLNKSVFYIAGYEDLLAPPKDVNNLVKALVNSPKAEVKFYEAGHCSFMWGIKLEFLDDLWQNLLL